MENNALNNFNPNTNVNQEEKKKNNVYLNLKIKTNSGDVRRFSFLLCNSGSGLEQSNANAVITNALTKDLEEANTYLSEIFANPEKWASGRIEGSCYLSGVKSSPKDWVNDI